MNPSIEIHGLKQLEKNLLALGAELGAKTFRAALMDAAEPLKQEIINNTPVGKYEERIVKTKKGGSVRITPGFMKSRVKKRSSINRKGSASRKFNKNTSAIVRVGVFRVPYAGFVEFGTSKAAAQPFVRPAAVSQFSNVTNIFKQRLQHRIKLAVKRLARQKAAK